MELLLQPISSPQDVLDDSEVLFLSVQSAMVTEGTVADSNSNSVSQKNYGQGEGHRKRQIDPANCQESDDSPKRQHEVDNNNKDVSSESKNNIESSCPTAKVVIQKHPYNVSVPRPKARTLGGNHLLKKMMLSHDQIINLVAHCLDDLEIPIFLNLFHCIRIKPTNPRVSVPSFLDCIPPFVHPEITRIFGMEKICKTPVWAIAHCLFCLTNYGKNYRMF